MARQWLEARFHVRGNDCSFSMRLTSPKREARYRQLLQAAVKVFARDGIDAASVADIAEAAGVAKGSVYLYFDSKETLSGDLVGYLFTFPDEGERLSLEPQPLQRIVRFCTALEERVMALGTDAPIVLHMFGHIGKSRDDQLGRGVRQLMAESRLLVAVLLDNARRRGELPQGLDVSLGAASLVAVTFGVLHSRLADGYVSGNGGLGVADAVRTHLQGMGAHTVREA